MDDKINREIANRPHKFTETEIMEYLNQSLENTSETLVNILINKVIIFKDNIQIYFNTLATVDDYDDELPNPKDKVLISSRKRMLEESEVDVNLYI